MRGTLVLRDRSQTGARIRVELLIDFEGPRIEPYETTVRGDELPLDHAIAEQGVKRWLREHLAGEEFLRLTPDLVSLARPRPEEPTPR